MQTIYSDRKKISGYLGVEEKDLEGASGNCDFSDGFIGVYIHQTYKLCTLKMCGILNVSYTPLNS